MPLICFKRGKGEMYAKNSDKSPSETEACYYKICLNIRYPNITHGAIRKPI